MSNISVTNNRIDLECANVDDDTCAALANFIESEAPPTLEEINLQNNRIGDKGIATLANALAITPRLTKLRVLYLAHNDIGNEGIKVLTKALVESSHLGSLEEIWLSRNLIDHVGYTTIEEAIVGVSHLDNLMFQY